MFFTLCMVLHLFQFCILLKLIFLWLNWISVLHKWFPLMNEFIICIVRIFLSVTLVYAFQTMAISLHLHIHWLVNSNSIFRIFFESEFSKLLQMFMYFVLHGLCLSCSETWRLIIQILELVRRLNVEFGIQPNAILLCEDYDSRFKSL